LDRRAKIICTIGPATSSPKKLRELIAAGMDVARLNFSHGTHADHASVITAVRELAAAAGRPVAVLQDLQGPKIRIGALAGGSVELVKGSRFVLTTDDPGEGNATRAGVSYAGLPEDMSPGHSILLQDGLLRLQVEQVAGTEIVCRVIDGGILRQRAGINLPGAELSLPSLTDKDRADLAFGLEQAVDIVALSFVRGAIDMETLRDAVADASPTHTPLLVAKLEKPQAITALDDILAVADGVMVARGDLGVEVSPERVPFMQKTIIRRAAAARVPVITATQMLESMVSNPRPTRAEASDVANAVFDGTDAVMLSAETSIGEYPLEAVRMMDRIVCEAETHQIHAPERRHRGADAPPVSVPEIMAEAASRAAADLHAAALVAFTQSGFTGKLISKHRPSTPIVAYTPNQAVLRQLALYWGVTPRQAPELDSTDELIAWADSDLRDSGMAHAGDHLVFLAGSPTWQRGITNLMRLHRAGDEVS
jgi:pyruvate kinase